MQSEVTIINGDIEIISKTLANNYPPEPIKLCCVKFCRENDFDFQPKIRSDSIHRKHGCMSVN